MGFAEAVTGTLMHLEAPSLQCRQDKEMMRVRTCNRQLALMSNARQICFQGDGPAFAPRMIYTRACACLMLHAYWPTTGSQVPTHAALT
ncbi:unnamed protein product [Prunus armeniaca]|uniref:Uncharacterized protein n=1 Tax=Prunus armeniaca TaxID=36596 RepID=A0A6J5XJE2_PRUAR|nr:unnamed protein product [Prunus armeniaca]